MIAPWQWVTVAAIVAAIGGQYLQLRRRSPALANVFGLGVAVRCLAGAALFVISFAGLPALARLQLGGGFWVVAPDAQVYFDTAYRVAADGLGTVSSATPSPMFVKALAVWFMAAGASPATAVLFNVACYCLAVLLITGAADSQRSFRRTDLVAISFAPVLLLSSTQVLKDGFFALAMVLTFVGASRLCAAARENRPRAVVLATSAVAVGMMAIAGIRAYFALILWAAAAIAAFAGVAQQRFRIKSVATAGAILAVLWIAFAVGAADYYGAYSNLSARTTGIPFPTVAGLRQGGVGPIAVADERGTASIAGTFIRLRQGFVATGGATNFHFGMNVGSLLDGIVDAAYGLLALFVPISVLQWLSILSVSGGRGFLFLTDLDTVFMDAAILASVWLLARPRAAVRENLAYVVLVVATAGISALLLGFIVTNYGTLFRLRLMVSLPLWLLALAIPAERPVAYRAKGPGGDPLPIDVPRIARA